MKIQWSLILGLVFALITAIFAVINVDPVQVNLLFGVVQVPLILLILGCTLLGGLIVGSYGIYLQYRLQRKLKATKAELQHIIDATGYTYPVSQDALSSTHPSNPDEEKSNHEPTL
ncbi:lipopolysaccharide assembly LapA domain-containing protein [Paenibacillus terrigena]|uniref:LapA family protein n=1 Tax=Paenibacillus terrigena TaxID=369333 RepID=UPI00037D24F2|nr:lipopolysaccharide assembly protein LapA domain-containing protein [Paenibacillus terrigena]